MWWLADPLDLHRVSERVSTLYVERSHVDRAENAIVVVNKARTVRVPAAYVASLMLGPGTRITHAAMRLLSDSGTAVSWVGESGVRMYAHGLGPSRSGSVALSQAHLVSHKVERLGVARRMYAMRFPGEDVSTATMQELRGREGARVKRIYRAESERTGVEWRRRTYKSGDAFAAGDDINRALSAAHACLYALSHAAIVGVGAVPSLGFVHTGSAVSFVLDIADLYKAEYSIPVAFDAVANGQCDEADVRYAMRERFNDGRLLKRIVGDILGLLGASARADEEPQERLLWDEKVGAVVGGQNWSEGFEALRSDGFAAITGPDLVEPQVPW